MEFPPDLGHALERLSGSISRTTLSKATERISNLYRRESSDSTNLFVYNRDDAVAYAAYRFPATFAAAMACFTYTRQQQPDFRPSTLLDVGAGTGAAAWAALAVWPDIHSVQLVERDRHMVHVGQALMDGSAMPSLRDAQWKHFDVMASSHFDSTDLVVASYVTGEIPAADRDGLLDQIWHACSGTLVVVEPGTKAGYRTILGARGRLLAQGGIMVAPCPHGAACPIANGDWCHFSQRLPRSEGHRAAKHAALSYEDEKYSYVAVSRLPAKTAEARVIRHPQFRTGRVGLVLCATGGIQQRLVTRREKDAFRLARHARWGDAFPSHVATPEGS